MFAILSPAKKLRLLEQPPTHHFTQSVMLEHTELLMQTTRALSSVDLQGLMKISEALGDLNYQRFQDFSLPFSPADAHQAVYSFAGDTYRGFAAETLSGDDLEWAQQHLGLLSGLYGLLRPLDLIQPYRLEMGTRLQNPRGKNLYEFNE